MKREGAKKPRKADAAVRAKPSPTRLRARIGTLRRRLNALNEEADGSARQLLGDAARFLGAALARLQEADEVMSHDVDRRRTAQTTVTQTRAARQSDVADASASEALFASAFHCAMGGMAIVALDGHPIKVNQALRALLGYSEEELCRATVFDFTHPDDVAASRALVENLLAGAGVSGRMEKRYLHKDGSIVWALLAVTLVRSADGTPLYLVAQVEDIGDRRAALNALQDSERRFQSAFDDAPVGMVLSRPDGSPLRVNRALCDMVGYSAAELLAMRANQISHPDDVHLADERLAAALADGDSKGTVDLRYLHKNGHVVWGRVAGSIVRGANGEPSHIIVQIQDITERRRVSQALRASEAKNQAILEASPDTFVRIRRDGTIVDVKGDTSSWRTPAAETMGRALGELMPPEMAASALQTVERAISTGELQTYELETPTAQGVLWLEARIVACGGDEALCSLRDISARRRAEHEARQRLTDLAHVARVSNMGEMAAALAHELNQPLMAIVGYASGCALRVEGGMIDPPELQHALRQVSQQAVRAGEILRRLRDFVRKGRPQRSRVDVNSLAREVRGLADVEARQHAVVLRLELDETLPEISVDPIQIEQVMLNLIRNGIEAMSEITTPRVLTLRTSRASATAVAVTVIDCGKGLPTGIADLFEPFVTTKPTGLGLGLSISRSIVEAHGGRLAAWSGEGPTTVFELTLPVARGGTR